MLPVVWLSPYTNIMVLLFLFDPFKQNNEKKLCTGDLLGNLQNWLNINPANLIRYRQHNPNW